MTEKRERDKNEAHIGINFFSYLRAPKYIRSSLESEVWEGCGVEGTWSFLGWQVPQEEERGRTVSAHMACFAPSGIS